MIRLLQKIWSKGLVTIKYPSLAKLSNDQEYHGPLLPHLVKKHQKVSSILRVRFLRRVLKEQETFRGRRVWVRKSWRSYMLFRPKRKHQMKYVLGVFKFG